LSIRNFDELAKNQNSFGPLFRVTIDSFPYIGYSELQLTIRKPARFQTPDFYMQHSLDFTGEIVDY